LYTTLTYKISKRTIFLSIYLFVFLFLALYGNQGFQTLNQVILWGIGPLLAFYILEPNLGRLLTLPKEYYFYLSMVVFAFLGFMNVKNDEYFYRYLQVFIANFILMIIVYFSINNPREWMLAWLAVGLSGVTIAIASFFLQGTPIDTDEYFRLSGITGNANGTANYARVSVISALILLQFVKKRFVKAVIWSSIIFLSYTILLTASRGSFANLVFVLGGYFAFKYFSGFRVIILFVLFYLFGNLAFYLAEQFLSGFYLFDRLTRNDSVTAAFEEEARFQLYAEAWDYFLKNPLLGVGLNQFRIYSGGKISHTDILDILVQLGIFAGIIYMAIYVRVARGILRLKKLITAKRDTRIYQLLIICFISEMFFGLSNPNWFSQIQMVVLSLVIVYITKLRNSNTSATFYQAEEPSSLQKRSGQRRNFGRR
jgi:O-antigen ligase